MIEAPLTGRLLVATPALGDPNFERGIVLLLDHDEQGTTGVVVNRPTAVRVADILPPWARLASSPGVIFQGGPVARDSALGLAVVPGNGDPLGWRRVFGGLGMVDLDAPPEVLAAEVGPLRIFAGYAGWGPGQLDREIAAGAWYVVESEPGDAFTDTPDRLWRAVLRRQRSSLALVATYPDDPSMN